MANQLRQSGRRPAEREEITLKGRFTQRFERHDKGPIIAQRQMCLPTRARFHAKVRPPVSCFVPGSFLDARFRKRRRTVRELLDLEWRAQQLRTPAYEVFVPA